MIKKGFGERQRGKRRFYPACDYPMTKKQFVTTNGIRFWVETEGKRKGIPLILIHGGPGFDHRGFHPKISILAKHRRLIYYDQRGCYMTSVPDSQDAYGVFYDVEDLEALRKALSLKQIDILGYSYGGLIALIYGLIYSKNIRHIIACSTPIGETDEEIEKRIASHPLSKAFKKVKLRKESLELYYKFYFRKPVDPKVRRYNEMARNAYNTTKKNRRLIKGYDRDKVLNRVLGLLNWEECIRQIKKPVLLINGKYDPIVSARITKRLLSNVSTAKFALFNESSHDPFADETAKFERVVNRFLLPA